MRESDVLEVEYIHFFFLINTKERGNYSGGSSPLSEHFHFHNKRIKFQEPDFVNRVNHLIAARLCHACLYSA